MKRIAACVGLLVALASPAWPDESARSSPGSIYLGLEAGDSDTHRVDAGGQWRFNEKWSAAAQLSRGRSKGEFTDYDSTFVAARASHDFGPLGLGLGFRRGEIDGVSENSGVFITVSGDLRSIRLTAEMEARETDLAPTPFTDDLGPGFGVRSGVSRCDVDGRGYQLRADLDQPGWAGFASWRYIDYDDFDCELTLDSAPGNGPPAHARGRALGRRLGALPLEPVSGLAARRPPPDVVLLESSITLGMIRPVGRQWLGGAELSRDTELIADGDYVTALVFANRPVSPRWTMELTVGYTHADFDDTAFAGVRMTAQL